MTTAASQEAFLQTFHAEHPAATSEMLAPAGFAPVDWETVIIDLSGSVEEVWGGISTLYTFDVLDPLVMERLREVFAAKARETATPEGEVPFALRVHLTTTHLR